jgi:hypothetical protein
MTDKNYTDITIVLDRSGSMSRLWDDTIGGIETFITQQQKLPGKALLSLYTFDTEVDHVLKAKSIADASKSDLDGVTPRGSTALYDALNQAISETGTRFAKLPEDQRPGQVVFVVVTDGAENASREIRDPNRIREIVKHQETKYAWNFLFLGANIDAFAAGGAVGMKGVQYDASGAGMKAAIRATSAYVGSSRMRGSNVAGATLLGDAVLSARSVDDSASVNAADLMDEIADAYSRGLDNSAVENLIKQKTQTPDSESK